MKPAVEKIGIVKFFFFFVVHIFSFLQIIITKAHRLEDIITEVLYQA